MHENLVNYATRIQIVIVGICNLRAAAVQIVA